MSRTIIIAGGGPAGLMLACELRLAGVEAIVLEPRTERPEMSPGMAVHGRTLELFRQRGLYDRIDPEDIWAWPRTPFALLWLDMTGAAETDYTYAFPQWRTERLLLERALELGADLRTGHELVSFAEHATGVTVVAQGPGGALQLHGDYLVGCDGAGSRVRELAGITFPASSDTYHGVFGDMEVSDDLDDAFSVGVHESGVFGALPLNAEILRLMTLEFGVEPPPGDVPVTEEELLDSIERTSGRRPKVGKMRWLSRFGGPTRLAGSYRAGRVFLVGDAAHSLFISGSQGLNTSLHDATNLGWKLAAAVNGWAPPGLLDSYEAERHPVGKRMVWHASASVAMLHPLERVGPLRELVTRLLGFEDANRHMLRIPTDVRYPMGDGRPGGPDAGAAHPLLGGVVPDVPLVTGGGIDSVAQTLRTGRGVLLDVSGGAADLEQAEGWANRVDVVTAARSDELGAAVVLIRPDGYVAHADATGDDREGLHAALTTWFGAPTPMLAASVTPGTAAG
jgi:3-(3-hydroxy-phenyl)propionate hydroxylase